MTPFCVRASSASELVRKVLASLVRDDVVDADPRHDVYSPIWEKNSPRGMPIREHRHVWYRLEDTRRCAAWLPGRKLSYPFMVAEFLWIFCGRDDLEMIGTYCKEIHKFSDDGRTLFGAYGPRWRGQIGAVVENLRRDPDSRQGVVSIWRPQALAAGEYDPSDASVATVPSKDVPCTLSMQYLIRNKKLEAGVVMRSSDAWLGLPYDIFNFSMLQRAVAEELGVQAGSLTMYIGSSHLYERNLEAAANVLKWERAQYEHGGLQPPFIIQAPPGIKHEEVMLLEEIIRNSKKEDEVNQPNLIVPGAWADLLSVLVCHKYGDPSYLCYPWDTLEESPL